MRNAYQDQLVHIREELLRMAGLVRQAVTDATVALLEGDAALAEKVISNDAAIDRLREQIDDHSFEVLSLQNPVAGDLRMLVASLRMVSELERMGDLAEHIAKIARMRVPELAVPDPVIPTISRMAAVAELMISNVEHIIAESDVDAAKELEMVDQEMDRLRRSSFRELLGSDWKYGVEPAVDVALLGRYYERIADHAVSIARRVVFLVTGELPHQQDAAAGPQ
jgi:phosphate transport system protein